MQSGSGGSQRNQSFGSRLVSCVEATGHIAMHSRFTFALFSSGACAFLALKWKPMEALAEVAVKVL